MTEFSPQPAAIALVREYYPRQFWSDHCQFLGGAAGFSGARFWRLTTECGMYCLRRWPSTHPSRERLQQIHSILQWAVRAGFERLPMPVETIQGETFVWRDRHFWELARWIPGRADFHDDPTGAKLAAALQALAAFHQAVADHPSRPNEPAVSPGLQQRLSQLQLLDRGGIEQLRLAVEHQSDPQFGSIGRRMLKWLPEAASRASLVAQSARNAVVPLQPAIRDIWHDHVLFQGEQVTGIVDFGSMRIESVSGDVARLLGSLLRQGPANWSGGLAAYEAIRPLDSVERALLPVFDCTSIVLSAANWLTWLFQEGRTFEDSEAVLRRLHEVELRLASFVEGSDAWYS